MKLVNFCPIDWWIYLLILKEDKYADLDLESRWEFTDKERLVVRGTLCLRVASTFDICQLFDDPVPVVHPNPTEAKEDSIDVNFSAPQISVPTHRPQDYNVMGFLGSRFEMIFNKGWRRTVFDP